MAEISGNNGSARIIREPDSNNTSTENLGIGEVFTGGWTPNKVGSTLVYQILTDQASATDGILVEMSTDGVNPSHIHPFQTDANTPNGGHNVVTLTGDFYRIVYTNGAVATTIFNLSASISADSSSVHSHPLFFEFDENHPVNIIRSITAGFDQNGIPRNIKSTEVGALVGADFLVEVARGNIPGYSFNRKFGSIDSVQAATAADVWSFGITSGAEIYTFSADGVADIDRLSSDSSADTDIDIVVEGLDVNGDEVIQTIATDAVDGQTPVALTTSLWRVNSAYNTNGTDLLGNLYIFVNGATTGGVPNTVTDVRGHIPIGEGQTLQSIFTVPNGQTGFLYGRETSLTKGLGATAISAELRGRAREFGKVFRTQDKFALTSSGSSNQPYNFPVPLAFPGKTDLVPNADVSANGVGISWAYTLLLIDD